MSAGGEHFLGGKRFIVTADRTLPTGAHHVEILTENGVRRSVLLESYEYTPQVIEGIADALIAGRRIVKGAHVGKRHGR